MKAMIIVAMLMLAGCASVPEPAKETSVENVIGVAGYSKAQIYASAKVWIAESFRSDIQHDDKDAGLIIGNGSVAYVCNRDADTCKAIAGMSYRFNFKMRLDIKDEKVRITLTDMRLGGPRAGEYPLPQDDFEGNARGTLSSLSKELHASITKPKANW